MAVPLPLTRGNRVALARAFAAVPRVDLSIDCVLEDQMGSALVDRFPDPEAYQIAVPPFAYFAGNPLSPGGQTMLAELGQDELLMPSGPGWAEEASQMYGDRLVAFSRHQFSSSALSEQHLNEVLRSSPLAGRLAPMDLKLASAVRGNDHFVDLSAYDSPEDFLDRGIGFHVSEEGEILGAAYASLVCSRGIEVSLFVCAGCRRQGMGTALASRLALWALERGLEPHWDAANLESCRLAERLGYTPAGVYDAYYLRR